MTAMSFFDRPPPWSTPQLRCRICGGANADRDRLVVERNRPAIAYHERCLHAAVGDEISFIERDLHEQRALNQEEEPSPQLREWDLKELAAVRTRLDELRSELAGDLADRSRKLDGLLKEAIREWLDQASRRADRSGRQTSFGTGRRVARRPR